ncbi:hypothetical protein TNCV_497781 [Trichonephila clavipes]|nr:hypothetical protein TNCV_497781 [Trichonephila clavipes]
MKNTQQLYLQRRRQSVVFNRGLTSFGTVIFPRTVIPPRPIVIGHLSNTKEGTSSGDILILDSQTFFIPDFSRKASDKALRREIAGLNIVFIPSPVGKEIRHILMMGHQQVSPCEPFNEISSIRAFGYSCTLVETARHKALRLAWARQRQHWTVDDWKQVAWSDESRF